MRRIKKWLLSACGAIGGLCLVFAGFGFANKDVPSVKAEESGLSAYDVYGGSVRLVDDDHGNGIRFHVGMTLENFANYGTIAEDGKTGVLNSNYQTGTLLLPTHLLNGKELVKGGTGYKATLSDTDTSELWYKKAIGNVEYMQTVVYLYNIPETDLGTEISVRGYVYDKTTQQPTYTDQLDTISMSAVADMEYYDEASTLTAEQKADLKESYLDKEVTFHINGSTSTTRELYYNTPVSTAETPATVDNAEFVGWYKKDGITLFDFTAPVKNDTNAYAIYRRDISIENGAKVEDYIKDYTYTSVESAVYTAPTGNEYVLASSVGDMDLSELIDVPQDHGEGTLTVTMQNGDSTFAVPLPVTVVTKYIGANSDLQDLMNACAVYENFAPVYGYYKMTNNLTVTAVNPKDVGWSEAWVSNWSDAQRGFQGTLDGNNYTINNTSNQMGGLFVSMRNATIKNVTLNSGWYTGGTYAIFAYAMYDTKVENVVINLNGGDRTNCQGIVAQGTANSCSFKNVTVKASNGTTKQVSLFGTNFYGKQDHALACTFENFVIEDFTIDYLGKSSNITAGKTYTFIVEGQEKVDDTYLVIPGIIVKTNTASATVSGTQEVILNSDSNAIDLGDGYEDADIISVTLGGYDLGTNLSALEIPQNMISDGAVFGTQTITVLANVNGVATTISVPVSVAQVETTKVTVSAQELLMTDDTFSISLGSQYKTAQIQSILLDGNNLGTNLSALNVPESITGNTQNHGEKEIIVSATYKGAPYQFTVPVTLVTEYITTIERIWVLRPKANNTALYGYYKLANDVGSSTYAWVTGTGAPDTNGSTDGWRATLDGNGYSITYQSAYNCRGLFGEIGAGAVIKNVTINDYGYASDYAHSGLSRNIKDATFTNVVYNVCSRVNNANYRTSGVLANNGFSGNTFTNVVVNAQGLTIDSIFGQSFNASSCTFTNCYVYASSLGELGNTSADYTLNAFPAETAVTSVDGITVETEPTNTNVTLDGTQDIVLSSATNALDLGAYANAGNVTSITLTMGGVNYDLGKDASALNIPSTVVDAKDKHGNATVKVVCADNLSLSTTTITINVLVVTKDITTVDELKEVFNMTTGNTAYYGYYRLANDIGDSNFVFKNDSADHSWRLYGFRGTFDGNGKTITGKTGVKGIFGYINEGAVIKNVTINDKEYQGSAYTAVLATSIVRATIENVTVNHQGGTPTTETADNRGYLAYASVYGSTFKNVTVNAEGKDLPSIFGGYTFWGYERHTDATITEENSFENVVIIANAIGEIGHCSGFTSGDTTVTKVTSEEGILLSLPTVKVTLPAQDVLVSSPSLDLGEYAGMTVASIKSLDGATDYGTNASSLTNVTAGEYTLVVSGTLNNQNHEITLPVVFADGIITTMKELESAVRYYGTNKSGYYILGKDVSYTESGFALDKNPTRAYISAGTTGFIGTLNGMGHTITWNMATGVDGIFGTAGAATVKNLTINAVNYVAGSGKCVVAYISNASLTDVTINISGSGEISTASGYGTLIGNVIYGGTWTNVTVNSTVGIGTLLGTNTNLASSKYTNCVVNAPSLTWYDGSHNTATGWTHIIAQSLTEREVLIDTDKTLDLGEYAGLTVTSIKTANGEYDFGTDANALEIPDGLTTGKTTLIVMATDGTLNYKITVPVNFCSYEEATNIEITDQTEQAIDLGITAGTVNADQTYTIALEGLSKYNFVSATMNVDGKTHTFETMTFNVSVFGKTFGATEMTITYLYSNENRTITVPVVLATKVLTTASDINSWTAWADAYDGTTGDWKYDGYFVLGNDIDYNGTFEPLSYGQADATGKPIEVASGQEELGFRGTFDGRGYAIKNMRVSDTFNGTRYWSTTTPDHHIFEKNEVDKGTHYRMTAFITKMHADGVLRNVAFVGGVADYNAYLVGWGEGLVENVYVKYTMKNAVDSQYVVTINNGSAYGKVTMKNSIIDITEHQFNFASANISYFIIGQANDSYNLYQNVFIVGEMADNMVAVRYQNTDLQGGEDGSIPRGYDYFANYSTVGEFLAQHADQVNRWDYFNADEDEVWMNGDALMTATQTVDKSNTQYFINTDGTATDYVIVYDDRNDSAREMAGFIGETFYRATGTVTYTASTTMTGTFAENVQGGVVLPRATTATWSDTACYIVIGDVQDMPVSKALEGLNTTNTYVIQSYGKSVFIYAEDENDYLAAAYNFLEEALGFRAYDDEVITFNYQHGITFDESTFNIVVESAFGVRSQTGATNPYKTTQRTTNGMDFWSMGPMGQAYGEEEARVYGVHNTMYWLPYTEYSSSYAKWYRDGIEKKDANGNTLYTAYDICYTAGGDSTAYSAMVSTLAGLMVKVLDANPDKTALSFSMMDDYSMSACTCTACTKINSSNNTAVALKFLSDVASAIESERPDREFELYMLAYYYLLTAPTTSELTSAGLTDGTLNTHVGVLYAPVRVADESLGLQANDKNKAVYDDMVAWSKLTNNVALWFYDTIYHNYMVPIDTFESMISWLAYAVEIFGTDVAWITVNGQSKQYAQTAFESFKGYVVHRAEIEVYEKVVKGGITDAKIKAYLTELESEFFNFTVGTDGTKTFADGGYYGTATANEAMYNFYSSMCTNYRSKRDGSAKAFEGKTEWWDITDTTDMTGSCVEEYDYMQYGSSKATYENWLASDNTSNHYFANFTKAEINGYMANLETAMASVNGLSDDNPMKKVYQQKILIESLFPRFVICNGNHSSYWANGFSHSGASVWSGALTSARTAFKTDCTSLGVTYYEEHALMSAVFTKWGV